MARPRFEKLCPIRPEENLSKQVVLLLPLVLPVYWHLVKIRKPKNKAVNINFNNTYQWKMVTTWPPNFPVLGEGCKLLARWIEEMSGGRLKIEVYGGGELIPSLECFDAVSHGAVEMASGSGYYWAGKIPAAQFFSSVPFGMNAQQMNAWIINGGGNQLWEEIYEPFNLIPLPGGNTGVQAGGWYNKEINSIEDYEGLKMQDARAWVARLSTKQGEQQCSWQEQNYSQTWKEA